MDVIIMENLEISRPRKRLTELLLQHSGEHDHTKLSTHRKVDVKSWDLLFNRTPLEIVASKTEESVAGLTVGVNRLTGSNLENPQIEETGIQETIPCGIVLKSIGYKSLPLAEELPFDQSRGIIRQKEGRVEGMPGNQVKDFSFFSYCLIINDLKLAYRCLLQRLGCQWTCRCNSVYTTKRPRRRTPNIGGPLKRRVQIRQFF